MRKNLVLTAWLLFPILVFAGLVVWIFVSASKPKAMMVDPVGPGAGDTGGANALGEWIAGRDPDQVQRANVARRERRPIDPLDWPGGIEIAVAGPPDRPVSFGWVDPATGLLRSRVLRHRDNAWRAFFVDRLPEPGTPVFVGRGEMTQRIFGTQRSVTDATGAVVTPRTLQPVVPEGTPASEPLIVRIEPGG
ncbi:MAG: hypothetical protein AAGA55_08705 [Planctomycetota bacterium]